MGKDLQRTLGKLEERTELTDSDIFNLSGLLGVMDYSERMADLSDRKRKWTKDDTLIKLEIVHYMTQRISKDRKGRKEAYGLEGLKSMPTISTGSTEGGLFDPIQEKIYADSESDKKRSMWSKIWRKK